MFWQNYNDICESNGVRPRKVAAELGIADATVTRWKNGSIPNRSTLEKIAARFDVTVEFLLDNENISVDVKEKRSTFKSLPLFLRDGQAFTAVRILISISWLTYRSL